VSVVEPHSHRQWEPKHAYRETLSVSVSFAESFRAEFPALHRYLRRRVGAAAADDLASETFAIAYARWESFDQSRPLRPWLYGIASNLARHQWRSERRKLLAYARTGVDPVTSDLDDALGRVDADAQRRQLAAALATLRDEDRNILLLHAWAELTDAEVATALSLPIGTVKSRLHRTRSQLGNRLSPNGQVPVKADAVPEKEATP
jgi:RNA polymerase sigma factor (sigma-70 family)